jgi:hypothetical protein
MRFTFWVQWVLINIFGSVLGIYLSLVLFKFLPSEIITSAILGAVIGLNHWIILRKYLPHPQRWAWLLANALSVSFGFLVFSIIQWATVGAWAFILQQSLGFAIVGYIVGNTQWYILRQYFYKARWWVRANIAGWLLGGLVASIADLRFPDVTKICVSYAIISSVVGARTGLTLLQLIKNPISSGVKSPNVGKKWATVCCVLFLIITFSAYEYASRALIILRSVPPINAISPLTGLPARDCVGNNAFCTEMVSFEPRFTQGYSDYPQSGETWDNQYGSYLRRDLMLLITYATTRVARESAPWGYCQPGPIVLGDMSEKNGAIPGTSQGKPSHPFGSHQSGKDIDIAYYQLNNNGWLKIENHIAVRKGNLIRSICKTTLFGIEVNHCTEFPRLLDPWRTALLIAHISEHLFIRVIGVDGQIGIVLEKTLDKLVEDGKITPELRARIPLAYELKNQNDAWFRNHYNHLHVSMKLR